MVVNMFNVFRECRHKTAGTALISELPNLPKFPAGECSHTPPPPPQKLTPFFFYDTEWQRGEAVFRVLCHLPKCIQFCSDYSLLDFRYFYTTYKRELPNLPKFPAGECSHTPPPPRPRSLRLFFFYDTEWQRDEADSLLDFRYFYTTFIFKRVFWLTRTITRSRGFAPSSYTFALFSRTKPRFQVRRNSKLVYSTFCNFSHQS